MGNGQGRKGIGCGWGSRTSNEPDYAKHDSLATIAHRTLPIDTSNFLTVGETMYEGRYKVHALGGCGAFGEVYFASDEESNDDVAIKVLPHDPFGGAQSEVALLTVVRNADVRGKCPIVRFDGAFRHKGLDCLVFERLGADMYEVLRATRHSGISLPDIRRVARCLLRAFVLLRQEDIVHCDVKPENILVARGLGSYASTKDVMEESKALRVKLIDFGSARQADQSPETYMQSRFYRAPDVMLGCRISSAVDMWSLGCVLVELLCGDPLFPGQDMHEMLYLMQLCLGPVPQHVLRQGSYVPIRQMFDPRDVKTQRSVRKTSMRSLNDECIFWKLRPVKKRNLSPGAAEAIRMGMPVEDRVQASLALHGRTGEEDDESLALFVDLVSKMLNYDLDSRIKPIEALSHPFLAAKRTTTTPRTPVDDDKGAGAGAPAPNAGAGRPDDGSGAGHAPRGSPRSRHSANNSLELAPPSPMVTSNDGDALLGLEAEHVEVNISDDDDEVGGGGGATTEGDSEANDRPGSLPVYEEVHDSLSVDDCAESESGAPTPRSRKVMFGSHSDREPRHHSSHGSAADAGADDGHVLSAAEKLTYDEARTRRSQSVPGPMLAPPSLSRMRSEQPPSHGSGHKHHHSAVPFHSTYASHMNARFMKEHEHDAGHHRAHSLWSLERDVRDSRALGSLAAHWRPEERGRRHTDAVFAVGATSSAPLRHSNPHARTHEGSRLAPRDRRSMTVTGPPRPGSGGGGQAPRRTGSDDGHFSEGKRKPSSSGDLRRLAELHAAQAAASHAHEQHGPGRHGSHLRHSSADGLPPRLLAHAAASDGAALGATNGGSGDMARGRLHPAGSFIVQTAGGSLLQTGRGTPTHTPHGGVASTQPWRERHLHARPSFIRSSASPAHGGSDVNGGGGRAPSASQRQQRPYGGFPVTRSTTPDTRGVGRMAHHARAARHGGGLSNMWSGSPIKRSNAVPPDVPMGPHGSRRHDGLRPSLAVGTGGGVADGGLHSTPMPLSAVQRSISAGGGLTVPIPVDVLRTSASAGPVVPHQQQRSHSSRSRRRSSSHASSGGHPSPVALDVEDDTIRRLSSSRSHH